MMKMKLPNLIDTVAARMWFWIDTEKPINTLINFKPKNLNKKCINKVKL